MLLHITSKVVYISTWAGPPTMSHIDSSDQEVSAQLLRLCYGVSTLRCVGFLSAHVIHLYVVRLRYVIWLLL